MSPSTNSPRGSVRFIAIFGALIGAVAGYGSVELLKGQGIYAIVLPAALPGIFGTMLAKERSVGWAGLYALIGIVAALFTEWQLGPLSRHRSAVDFLTHLADMPPKIVFAIGLGASIGILNALVFGRTAKASSAGKG
jgi:hypothetical protein